VEFYLNINGNRFSSSVGYGTDFILSLLAIDIGAKKNTLNVKTIR